MNARPRASRFERPLAPISGHCPLQRAGWILFLWNFAAFAAAIYCIAKAVVDLRARRYGWGIVGLLSAVVFLVTPMQTHAVKIDLPAAQR